MLFRFMQECGLSLSRAYCIFPKSTNRNVQNDLLLKSRMGNWTKPLLLAGWAKIQYARDDERLHFCINLNKNIDNKVYCNANEFPNLIYCLIFQMLSVELLNVLHRLLLTRDSLASHVVIMSTVSRVVHGTRDVLARRRTESSTSDLGESEIEPGKSVVFGAMETCMCLLSRYFPSILADSEKPQPSPRLSVPSKGIAYWSHWNFWSCWSFPYLPPY
jgi:hypothetical protein